MKKTCGSGLSANGMVRSNTRPSEIGVDPETGAMINAVTSTAPKAASVTAIRVRIVCTFITARSGAPYRCLRQHVVGRTRCDDLAVPDQNQAPAQGGRQVQVMGGEDHRDAAVGVQAAQQGLHLN